jgi:hypothetical protein
MTGKFPNTTLGRIQVQHGPMFGYKCRIGLSPKPDWGRVADHQGKTSFWDTAAFEPIPYHPFREHGKEQLSRIVDLTESCSIRPNQA